MDSQDVKPIRVLHLVASSWGGGAAQVRDLALGLAHDQFRIFVAMPEDGGTVSRGDFEHAGVRFLPLPAVHRFGPGAVLRVRALLRELDIDILHVHGGRAAASGRLAVLGVGKKPRVVFTVHGFAAPFHSWAKRMSYLWLERLLQSVTHTTVCVARAEADLFGSFHLAPPDRIRIVHCGIDVDHFASPPTDAARLRDELRLGAGPVILTACRLHVPRDFDSLLAAFHTVQGEMPGARLVIAGDGPQRDRIRKRCDALCLTESVRLIGLRNDVAALLTLAQVSVLTSTGWEGFPVSTLEAQAAGVPVVVTDAGGSREAVLDGRTGFVIPKKDPNALAAVLMRLLRDGDLRRRLGAEGRKRAQAEFSRARMILRIREIYEELS